MSRDSENCSSLTLKAGLPIATRLSLEDFAMLVVVLALITVYANWAWLSSDFGMSAYIPPFAPGYNRMEQTHLGAECFNVAKSITQGHGFSHPFGDSTGPTGWVSPMLPYWMACGLWCVNGSREALTVLVLAMQILVLALTGTICLAVGRRMQSTSLALVAIAIVLCTNFKWMFQVTHDCVFQMLWVDVIFLGLWCFPTPCRRVSGLLGWGCVGGLCALAGPAAGGTFAIGTTIRWIFSRGASGEGKNQVLSSEPGSQGVDFMSRDALSVGVGSEGTGTNPRLAPCGSQFPTKSTDCSIWLRLRAIAIVGVVSLLVVSPWMLYQAMRLGKFVPIKSNSAFELYQGQCVVPDGMVVDMSFLLHPYHAFSEEGKRYREIGETAYLAEKQQATRHSILSNPKEYLRRVANRFLASTLLFQSEMKQDEKRFYFPLLQVLGMLPFFGFVLVAGRRFTLKSTTASRRTNPGTADEFDWVFPAGLCYFAYLLPYWFVSYYERYGVGASLPRMLFVLGLLVTIKRGFGQWSIGKNTQGE